MVHEDLTFADIMQSKILFYDKEVESACIDVCKFLRIDNMPGISGTHYFELYDNSFVERLIKKKQSVNVSDNIFINDETISKFKENQHNVLFVFEGEIIVGVVHISDYNSDVVLQSIQDDILSFERKLRQLLLLNGYTNNDMKAYFECCRNIAATKKEKEHYDRQLKKCDKNKPEMDKLGAFQVFDFGELMDFANDYGDMPSHKFTQYDKSDNAKGIIEKLRLLRNMAMHGRNTINMNADTFIYTIDSLEDLVGVLKILRTQYLSVVKKIRNHPDFNYSMQLENKSKLEIIHKIHPKALEYFLGK